MKKFVSRFVLLLVLSFSLSPFIVAHAEVAEDSWTTMASMPTVRGSLEVAVVNGKIYAIGGYNYDLGVLDINEEYDPATNTWTTKKPMPTPRCNFGIAVYQNKIYVIGGETHTGEVTGANEVYDPSTDTWTTKTSMPTARRFLCANVVNGKIYLVGGIRGSPPDLIIFNVNEVYDPSTDSWTTKAQVPTAVFSYASAVVNKKIYVIGGGLGCSLNQIYDPETDTWTFGVSIPTAVGGAAAGATTGVSAPKRIYVLGGTGDLVPISLNQVYDPEGDVWTTGARMPTPRTHLGVAVINDRLYAIGGRVTMELTAENEQYTPIGYGTVPPTISIVSPKNKTYTVNNVSLTFTVNKPTSWIGYSLDNQANVTITGNTTLSGLSNGMHSLTVYAKDSAGNIGTFETIYFTIEAPPFPTWILAAIVVIVVVVAALLVYFAKVKKTTGKVE